MGIDSSGRIIDYLRISLTDRCNLRCVYCMPPQGVSFKAREEILSFEEIERFAAIAVAEGINKIRLTGGEPLVRTGVVDHVRRLREITGLESIALTTNGILLPKFASDLRKAGLSRVNISIDSLDPETYKRMTRGGEVAVALAGIDAAFDAGFSPVKLNAVVVRSLEQDLLGFARMTIERALHVRFIEYMPIGDDAEEGEPGTADECGFHWTRADHVSAEEILATLTDTAEKAGYGALEPVARDAAPGGWGPARYYRLPESEGTIGVISPLSHHFCGECNRLRLTADGKLRGCLFSDDEIDVRFALRGGTDEDVRDLVRSALSFKPESHGSRIGTARRMSQIGG
ncbi:MAG: GTP 3',8-cyclase MoaA [Actinobacteria bacterium]|nr:GTP 3',8-cyclase MoaA [Actinomycetota bacterium]